MFGALIDYWYYTNDTTYNDVTSQGMLFQTGPNADFMPPNQTADLGNDDQIYWAFAAMTAAEYNFPDPPPNEPQWLALAQAVFNTQALRWDNSSCGGGLRWQIYSFNQGYNYKNSPSNMGLFNIAARLGAYTKNQTYLDWAEKTWNWMEDIGMISDTYDVWDGTDDTQNCTSWDHVEWTYTSGMAINGAAVMWNQTNSSTWYDRTQGLWTMSSKLFYEGQVMTEQACEKNAPVNCDTDQLRYLIPRSSPPSAMAHISCPTVSNPHTPASSPLPSKWPLGSTIRSSHTSGNPPKPPPLSASANLVVIRVGHFGSTMAFGSVQPQFSLDSGFADNHPTGRHHGRGTANVCASGHPV